MNGSLLRLAAISTLLIAAFFLFLTPLQSKNKSFEHPQSVSPEGLDLKTGTYTVLDFAASWCQPCYQALPQLQSLAKEHPALEFRVVCVDQDQTDCERLVTAIGLEPPVVWDGDHQIISRFSPDGFPATYVLDAKGRVLHHHEGTNRRAWQDFDAFLRQLDPVER